MGVSSENYEVIKVSNVNPAGKFRPPFEVRSFSRKAVAELLVQEGELLVVKSSGSKANVLSGKTALCGQLLSGKIVASNFLLRLRPIRERVVPKYLWYYLNSPYSKAFVKTIVGTTTYPNLKWDLYSKHPVPLPRLGEQERIVAILDKADLLNEKRSESLAKLDRLRQSIFLNMFGDVPSTGWDITDIVGVAKQGNGSIRTGPFGSQLLHSEFTSEGVAVLGIDNAVANEFRWGQRRFISEAKYRQLTRYTVRSGDVLITIMGTCGRCAIVPDDIPRAINTKHLCCITLDRKKCLPTFLHAYFLQHPIARKYLAQTAKGAIMSGLNMELIKAMPIPLPPLELQHEFERQIRILETLKLKQGRSLTKIEELFISLQQRAFGGELLLT